MRWRRCILLGIAAILLSYPASAIARRAAVGASKAKILRALGVPASLDQCDRVWTADLPRVGLWAFAVVTRGSGACSGEQPGDAAYLHRVKGRWHVVTQGNEIACQNGGSNLVPIEIQADLLGCPH